MASTIEMIDLSNRLFIQANSEANAKPPEPVHVPRPYDLPKEEHALKPATYDDMKEFFEDIRVTQ